MNDWADLGRTFKEAPEAPVDAVGHFDVAAESEDAALGDAAADASDGDPAAAAAEGGSASITHSQVRFGTKVLSRIDFHCSIMEAQLCVGTPSPRQINMLRPYHAQEGHFAISQDYVSNCH